VPKPGQKTAAEYEADFKSRMEKFRALSRKPKPKTEFTVENDDLIWAYRRAHLKDIAKLDAPRPRQSAEKSATMVRRCRWRRVGRPCRCPDSEDGWPTEISRTRARSRILNSCANTADVFEARQRLSASERART
jgi:hypothetical protein